MSIESVSRVLTDFPVGSTRKLVMLGIANHDGDGGAWPTVATLATYAAVSERSVQDALSWLEKEGWIKRHRQAGGKPGDEDRYRPNLYEILWTRFEIRGEEPRTPAEIRGAKSRGSGVKPTAPKPSYNRPRDARARESKDPDAPPVDKPRPALVLEEGDDGYAFVHPDALEPSTFHPLGVPAEVDTA